MTMLLVLCVRLGVVTEWPTLLADAMREVETAPGPPYRQRSAAKHHLQQHAEVSQPGRSHAITPLTHSQTSPEVR